jgi:hypothetical protein
MNESKKHRSFSFGGGEGGRGLTELPIVEVSDTTSVAIKNKSRKQ